MSSGLRQTLLFVALAMLGVRALTPLGYMPAPAGSGLLYELCPEGMPAEVLHVLGGGGHHHHHGDDDAGPAESCPIGHMLAPAMAVDVESSTVVAPEPAVFGGPSSEQGVWRAAFYHRCRSPPA
ncbi:MAG: hypothetical protein QNJ11_15585 [Woeseiaceae bacterium]|nr:hypothetical protein [Woeseiaceae bacterium]